MNGNLKKVVVRMAFEAVHDQLKNDLYNEGFEIGGTTDFQDHFNTHSAITNGKYKVMAVYDPFIYKEMMLLSPIEGMILPCLLSVLELYPGEVAISFYNPIKHLAREMKLDPLENLAGKVDEKFDSMIEPLRALRTTDPDLVTSWN